MVYFADNVIWDKKQLFEKLNWHELTPSLSQEIKRKETTQKTPQNNNNKKHCLKKRYS